MALNLENQIALDETVEQIAYITDKIVKNDTLIKSKAEYFAKLKSALVYEGFTPQDALEIVKAEAMGQSRAK